MDNNIFRVISQNLFSRVFGNYIFFWIGLDLLHDPFAPIGEYLTFLIIGGAGLYILKDLFKEGFDQHTSNLDSDENTYSVKIDIFKLDNWHKVIIEAMVLFAIWLFYAKGKYPDMELEITISCITFFVLTVCNYFYLERIFPNKK
jgi:hypothetical protein